jgi:FecR protein
MKKTFEAARALFFTLLMPLFLVSVSNAQDNDAPRQSSTDENPPSRVARLSFTKGNVSFLRAGLDQWSQATPNFPVTTGDRIYTDKKARAELEIGLYAVRLSETTDLTVTNLNDQITQLGVQQGTARVSVYELPSGDSLEVDTPNGALTFLKSGTFRVDVDPSGDFTVVSVNNGSVDVTAGTRSQTLQSGQAAKLTGRDPVEVLSVPLPRMDDFDTWSEERDKRISASASARYVSRWTPGFKDLDENGEWEEVAEYGPVWYPFGVAASWIPYRFGRWVWVGPWGWTWVEEEPWGFCPFHFGRWVHIGLRWGWLPGPYLVAPVYSPALVAFVGGPEFSVTVGVGVTSLTAWFPLGPGEPYFPWYHCREDYIRQVNITNIRNVTNITNITNISNVHYAYRNVATTAVPANVFRNGQPVARQAVHLTPQQLERAQIVPHPAVNPTQRAVLPGNPTVAPPVRARQPIANAKSTAVNRPAPNISSAIRPGTAAPNNRAQSLPNRMPENNPRTVPPPLIRRSGPPSPPVPFIDQRHAMHEHPGRPLEPQQLENLRARRPVGPMLDREFPPHLAPVPVRPPAPPRPARPHRP